jgi:hypothetical protein
MPALANAEIPINAETLPLPTKKKGAQGLVCAFWTGMTVCSLKCYFALARE